MAKRDEEREKRLAAALRENLKRRKAQARDAAGEGAGPLPPRGRVGVGVQGDRDRPKTSDPLTQTLSRRERA